MRYTDEWPAFAAIAAVFVVGWMLVRPWTDVPIIDDWVYAWSVEQLVKTGKLRVLDYSSIYPVAQILWGALFASVAGFSFGILRLSTVVLATIGCSAIYLTLRELGIDRSASLLAALAVALSPVHFSFAFTFMTEVPFVALSSVAIFFYVSALVRDRPSRLWWGGFAAVLAFLIRPIAVALPLSVAAGIPFSQWKRMRLGTVAPLGGSIVVMIALWIAMPRIFGHLPVADQRLEDLRYLSMVTFKQYADWNVELAFVAAFPLAPLILGSLASRRRAIAIGALTVVLTIALRAVNGGVPTPLPDWQTWSLQDMATRGGLLGGELAPSNWSVQVTPFVRVLGAIVVSALLVALATARRGPPAMRVLLALGLLHVLLINVLWFYNDRYYVVFLLPLATIAAWSIAGNRRAVWIAAPLLVLWGFIDITGTRDMLATNGVVRRLTRDLEAAGVPPSQIDAGYTQNGWRLYAHPENLPPNLDRRYDVPFLTSKERTRYGIVNVPGPNETVLRVEPLPAAWWQVTNRVYVVERQPER